MNKHTCTLTVIPERGIPVAHTGLSYDDAVYLSLVHDVPTSDIAAPCAEDFPRSAEAPDALAA